MKNRFQEGGQAGQLARPFFILISLCYFLTATKLQFPVFDIPSHTGLPGPTAVSLFLHQDETGIRRTADTELRAEHFRIFYTQFRETVSMETQKPLSEYTFEGVHATLCSILSDGVEGGFLCHHPTYRYAE